MHPALDYYAQQSAITDPGINEILFRWLPQGVGTRCLMVQGIMMHPVEAHRYEVKPRLKRMRELQLRSVEQKLIALRGLGCDDTLARPYLPEHRVLGNCRDYATMFCALLRHQGTPARVRCGFARYFEPDFFTDHVVCEYWKADEERWTLADAMLDIVLRQAYGVAFDITDVPRAQFILAGQAWQHYRAGALDPSRCGLSSKGPRGLAFIRTGLLRDIAALNKVELLTQDAWDIDGAESEQGIAEADLALLDRVAALSLAGNDAFADLRQVFEDDLRPRMLAALSGKQEG
ncbi:MAG TPA: transglutaminase-like domain-containing protein [Ktedonobacterales bacterium]|nr:transglutaminase-like domain-containing protein [Ktedonobacterales bacterium]